MRKALFMVLASLGGVGAGCPQITLPLDWTVAAGISRANLNLNPISIRDTYNACADSVDMLLGVLSGYGSSIAVSSNQDLVLRVDADANGTHKLAVLANSVDSMFRVHEDGTARFFDHLAVDSTVTAADGAFGGLNLSDLSASGLVATDASKNLSSTVSGLSPVFTGLGLSGLAASSLVATDGSKNLTSSVSGLSPIFTGLTLTGNGSVGGTWGVTGASTLTGNVGIGGATNGAIGLNITTSSFNSSTSQYGISLDPTFNSSATAQGYALEARVKTQAASFTIPTVAGIRLLNASKGAGSTITTQYGLKVEDQTQGGTNYAIHTGLGLVRFGDAVTMSSTLGVGGNLTITAASLRLASLASTLGIQSDVNTSYMSLSGGNASNAGANLLFYGGSHATLANDFYLRYGSTNIISWDASASRLQFDTGDLQANLSDNTSNAFDLQQGANNYINVNTSNGSENVSFGNATTNPSYSFLGTGATAFGGAVNVTDSISTGGNENFGYDYQVFACTLTAVTASVTTTCKATIIGKQITLVVPPIQGTSNGTGMTVKGIPSALDVFGSTSSTGYPHDGTPVLDNGATIAGTCALGYLANQIACGTTSAGTGLFTNSGTKGLPEGLFLSYIKP